MPSRPPSLPHPLLSLACANFFFFVFVSFVATTPDIFLFQSRERLSQVNVKDPVRLKFKHYAGFIE